MPQKVIEIVGVLRRPHAGDGGNFGREEIDIIRPVIEVTCSGPQRDKAMAAISALVEGKFGED